MRTTLHVNNNVIPLNDFTQGFIGNVLHLIGRSFGNDFKKVAVSIESDELHLYFDEGEVIIDVDNAKMLIENTVRGMLSSLRGVLWLQKITISPDSC